VCRAFSDYVILNKLTICHIADLQPINISDIDQIEKSYILMKKFKELKEKEFRTTYRITHSITLAQTLLLPPYFQFTNTNY